MDPSLKDGDQVLANHSAYDKYPPSRGDVVILEDPSDITRVELKRVIGLGGEEIMFCDGLLYVNGRSLVEPYLRGLPPTLGLISQTWELNQSECFVMGDNRVKSIDSRRYGPVRVESVVGRVWLCYWPPKSWGQVK